MISHVKFVSIPTTDQDRALTFYTEKLGFKLESDNAFDGKQRWIELSIGDSDTSFVLFTPPGHEDRIGSFFNGALACEDVNQTYLELKEKGVEFMGEPKQEPWGTFAMFKDPDGNQFVLSSSK
jgi:predicted enzyme related to lactoylglutathione lyase